MRRLSSAKEAVALWVDAALDAGSAIPSPSNLETLRHDPEYAGWILGVIELDAALFDDTIERVNVTLPKRVLCRLDALATAQGQSRGAFISDLTLRFGHQPH